MEIENVRKFCANCNTPFVTSKDEEGSLCVNCVSPILEEKPNQHKESWREEFNEKFWDRIIVKTVDKDFMLSNVPLGKDIKSFISQTREQAKEEGAREERERIVGMLEGRVPDKETTVIVEIDRDLHDCKPKSLIAMGYVQALKDAISAITKNNPGE